MTQPETTPPAPGPRCPRCDAVLPVDTPAGLCPACLISAHFGTAADLSEPAAVGAPTPAPEEIAPHFPQLEILSCLGRGGMGVVYKARQKSLGRLVALKLLAPERGSDPAFAERFTREAQVLARLDHPHIVTIHDFGQAGGYFYLLMEFVDGVTLRHLIHGGRLASREALAIVPQICDALQFAHDHGIVHRDIKPENILLDRRGLVKVADFGLVKLVGPGGEPAAGIGDAVAGSSVEFTEAGKVMGTPRYMAPEQREHPTEVDHRADIYALGVVLYQMLTGELPDEKQLQPPSRRVRLDVRLDEIVLRALEQEPSHRYASATEFKTRVETFAATPPPPPPPPGSPPPPPSFSNPSPAAPPDRETARALVKPAAIAMTIAGAFNLCGLLFGLAMSLLVLIAGQVITGFAPGLRFIPWIRMPLHIAMGLAMALVVGWLLVNVAVSVYVLVAAGRMRRLERHGSARAGAITLLALGALGLLFSLSWPASIFAACWSFAHFGIGVWALVVLAKPGVRAAFAATPATAPLSAPPSADQGLAVAAPPSADPLRVPANGLIVASGIQLALLGAALLVLLFFVSYRQAGSTGTLEIGQAPTLSYRVSTTPSFGPPLWLVWTAPGLFAAAAAALFTQVAAWRMRRRRSHGLAVTGALLAILGVQGFGLGILFGFWALVVLLRREVHETFDDGAPRRRRGSCLLALGTAAGLAILVGLVVTGLFFARKTRRGHFVASLGATQAGAPLPAPPASPGFVFGPENKFTLSLSPGFSVETRLAPTTDRPLPATVSYESADGVRIHGPGLVFQSVDSGQWEEFTQADNYRELRRFAASKPDISTVVQPAQGVLLFSSAEGPAGLLKISGTPGENDRLSVALKWKFFHIAPVVPVDPAMDALSAPDGPLPAVEAPALPENALDLAPFWTTPFTGEAADPGQGLGTLRGLQTFDGLPFLVGGRTTLAGQTLKTRADGSDLPSEISLPVARPFAELHLLHATHWQDPVGVEVATLRFRYADGETRSVALRYGVHLLDWQRLPGEEVEPLSDPASRIVWRGPGGLGPSSSARVILTTLANPRPDQPVERLELVASQALASYTLVAASVSAADPARERTAAAPPPNGTRSFTGELRIRVVNARTGEPLAGVFIEPYGTFQDTGVIAQPLFTDAAGVARLRYDPATTGDYSCQTRQAGYQQGRAEWNSAAAIPAEHLLRLEPSDQPPATPAAIPGREGLGQLKVSELLALQHECLARLVKLPVEASAPATTGPAPAPDAPAEAAPLLAGLLDSSAELVRRGACPGFVSPLHEPGLIPADDDPARLRIIMASVLEDALVLELQTLGQPRAEKPSGEDERRLAQRAIALAAELFRRSGWRDAGLPAAGSTSAPPSPVPNLKARLASAAAISNWEDRDRLYAALALEAVNAGDSALARSVLGRISDWRRRDRSLNESALVLKKLGRHDEAVEFAKAISDWRQRDATLVELTR